jgi:hypothetical protein
MSVDKLTVGSLFAGIQPGDLTVALSEPDSASRGKSRSTRSANRSSNGAGPGSSDGATFEPLAFCPTAGTRSVDAGPLAPTLKVESGGWKGALGVLISSSAASPARISASPASELDSAEPAPAFSGKSSASPKPSRRRGDFSRMFQGWLAPIGDGTWKPSSEGYGNAGLLLATGFWTASISESPSDAVVCSLSAVLQKEALPKYWLSSTAAAGILRRAAKRGRALPTHLQQALEARSSGVDAVPRIPT